MFFRCSYFSDQEENELCVCKVTGLQLLWCVCERERCRECACTYVYVNKKSFDCFSKDSSLQCQIVIFSGNIDFASIATAAATAAATSMAASGAGAKK